MEEKVELISGIEDEEVNLHEEDEKNDEDETKICRICFEDGAEISPCACKGTSRYVHIRCLEQWRQTSTNPEAYRTCMECRTDYAVTVPRYIKIEQCICNYCHPMCFAILRRIGSFILTPLLQPIIFANPNATVQLLYVNLNVYDCTFYIVEMYSFVACAFFVFICAASSPHRIRMCHETMDTLRVISPSFIMLFPLGYMLFIVSAILCFVLFFFSLDLLLFRTFRVHRNIVRRHSIRVTDYESI